MIRARLYEPLSDGAVKCLACNHYCTIAPGHTGVCGVRKNLDGQLFSLVYDRVVAAAVDPIEKNPFFISNPARSPFPLPRPDAILSADSARMRISPRSVTGVKTLFQAALPVRQ